MFFTSDTPSYKSPGLNGKIPDKQLRKGILDEDRDPTHGECEQTLEYMLQCMIMSSTEMMGNFNGHKGTFLYVLQNPPIGRKWNLLVLYLVFL